MMAGLFIYLIVYAASLYWESEAVSESHPHSMLLIGILGAVAAHLIEVNFGIAISSTLTTFWAYTGILAVAGMELISEEAGQREVRREGGSKRRRRRRKADSRSLPAWLGPTLSLALIGGFILGTMAFDFVTAPAPEDPYYVGIQQRLQREYSDPEVFEHWAGWTERRSRVSSTVLQFSGGDEQRDFPEGVSVAL